MSATSASKRPAVAGDVAVRRRRGVLLALILLAAFGVRGGAAFYWQSRLPADRDYLFSDTHGYLHLAQQILRGQPYEYGSSEFRIFRTPGYPLLLAGWSALIGTDDPPILWARMLSVVAGTAAVGLVMLLAGALFGFRAACLAGIVAAFYPGGIATSVFVLSEGPFIPLLVLQLFCWVRAVQEDRWVRWSLLAGAVAALATLVRPSWMLFVPFAIPFALLFRSRGQQLRVVGVMLASFAVVMLPWWIRNWRESGRFVATSLQMGASLYDGWNPEADGGSDMRFVAHYYREVKDEQKAGHFPARDFEWQLDRRMRDAAVDWAASHPGRVLVLAAEKFRRMWSPWPNSSDIGSFPARLVLAAGYVPVVLAGLAAAAWLGWRSFPFALCVLPAVYFTLLHMIFVSSLRYREPAMLPLIALGAGAALQYVGRQRNGPKPNRPETKPRPSKT